MTNAGACFNGQTGGLTPRTPEDIFEQKKLGTCAPLERRLS